MNYIQYIIKNKDRDPKSLDTLEEVAKALYLLSLSEMGPDNYPPQGWVCPNIKSHVSKRNPNLDVAYQVRKVAKKFLCGRYKTGKVFKYLKAIHYLSSYEIARELDVTEACVSGWERNHENTELPPLALKKLLEYSKS